ncbi:MAG: FtsH protease activity modulator HflK [Candidatus Auribacterota bacterium]|nr:FtsH protease activity modulator HflK [Candidatus Auribacterota bacterium]
MYQDTSNLNVTDELKNAVKHTRRFMKWIVLAVIVFYLSLGFYTIKTNELGVLELLGSVADKRVLPGLHYTFPWPFSRVYKVPVKKQESFAVADFFQDSLPNSRASIFYNLTGLESYALSGDNNAVEIKVIVQYRISDPFNYLFGATQKQGLLRDIICREIISLLAVRPVNIILTSGKDAIKNQLQINAQKKLDENKTGLSIHRVDIEDIRPPSSVQEYFDDVINAQIDKEKMKSRAESYANEEIARARGEADRKIQEASSYRDKAIQSAKGESARFKKILSEYRKVPQITRKRLYLEFARECLSRLKNTYLIDNRNGITPAKLHLLPGS